MVKLNLRGGKNTMIGRFLSAIALLTPWILSAFLAGMLVVKQEQLHLTKQFYEEWRAEANMRLSVQDSALNFAVGTNKFRKDDAILNGMRAFKKSER